MRYFIFIAALLCTAFIFGRVQYSQPYWEDLIGTSAKLKAPAAGAPHWVAFPAGSLASTYQFDDTTDECLEVAFQFPHKFKSASLWSPHVHWAPLTTSTNTVSWQFDYAVQEAPATVGAAGGTYTAAATVYTTACNGAATANAHQVCEFADITDAGLGQSAILIGRICRDADASGGLDSMVGDVSLLAFDIHIQEDSPGSWTEWSK